jgi:hypothetical protein
LGLLNLSLNCASLSLPDSGSLVRGNKLFELTNHLGNVLETISDKKIQHSSDNSTVDYYLADVINANDYYSFGMQMPGRGYAIGSAGNYRYGFNGQEKTDEIAGAGNHTTAEFWEYDTRVGRRWNLDPKPIAWSANYSVFANSPIYVTDPLGDTTYIYNTKGILKDVIYDKRENEVNILSDRIIAAIKNLDPKKYSTDAKAGLARSNAVARITSDVQKQLTANWTPLRKENVGYLYVDGKSNIAKIWVCPDCEAAPDPNNPFEKGEASVTKLENHEDAVAKLGTIIGMWHSHPSKGLQSSQPTQPDDITNATTVIKSLSAGGIGIIVQKNTITMYPIASSVPQIAKEETNIPSVNTPVFSKTYKGFKDSHQYGVFDQSIHPIIFWKY